VTPAPPGSRQGNRITALRWKRLLTELGHRVQINTRLSTRSRCDVLVALHARKSFPAIAAFKSKFPDRPIIVALTGTDLYGDLPAGNAEVASALYVANHLIVLQPKALERLPPRHRSKASVLLQSVQRVRNLASNPPWRRFLRTVPRPDRTNLFSVAVLGHLRDVKDPLRTAKAVRGLPAQLPVHVVHLGGAAEPAWQDAAEAEMKRNSRYHWLGDVPHRQALQVLGRCQLLCVTSQMEGGANVVMEALALGVPVISTRIDGSVGLLGDEYPGYFPFGDTASLQALIRRCATDETFYEELRERCLTLHELTLPELERAGWREILSQCVSRGNAQY
jgi:putative glycosyltransferase (TIGR04348 family)